MLVDLKELYVNEDKVKIIQEMLTNMVESMRKNNTLSTNENEEEQDPTVFLWLLYFSA